MDEKFTIPIYLLTITKKYTHHESNITAGWARGASTFKCRASYALHSRYSFGRGVKSVFGKIPKQKRSWETADCINRNHNKKIPIKSVDTDYELTPTALDGTPRKYRPHVLSPRF